MSANKQLMAPLTSTFHMGEILGIEICQLPGYQHFFKISYFVFNRIKKKTHTGLKRHGSE